MTWGRLILGLWGVAGILIAAVAAVGVFAIPETGNALKTFVAIYMLGCVVPFGAMCSQTARMGLNYGSSPIGNPNDTYVRRLKQGWSQIVPVSGTVALVLPAALAAVSIACDSGEGLVAAVISLFYTLPACFFLFFLPNGNSVIERWRAEDAGVV